MAQLMTLRVDDDLKEQFLEAAKSMNQNQSDAMRDALARYIRSARFKAMREAAERLSNNPAVQADDRDVMNEMAAYRSSGDDD
ncbi:ribbon-helix-helix domain-containing protein [Pseudomonas sp. R2.Fl]|nr:ribbon-helix-helix domain-containing protein [Pseudomonas sp. R2.Fl]